MINDKEFVNGMQLVLDMYSALSRGIKQMIKEKPDATAKDVLKMMNMTKKFVDLIETEMGGEDGDK